jgi:peroxiredoxin
VHLQEEHETAKDVVAQNKWTFRVLLDTDGQASKRWGGEPPPATLVVGRDGVVRTALPGYSEQMSEKWLREAVEKALEK